MSSGALPPRRFLPDGAPIALRDAAVRPPVVGPVSTRRARPSTVPRTVLTRHARVPRHPHRALHRVVLREPRGLLYP
jgi:hypothetical protein